MFLFSISILFLQLIHLARFQPGASPYGGPGMAGGQQDGQFQPVQPVQQPDGGIQTTQETTQPPILTQTMSKYDPGGVPVTPAITETDPTTTTIFSGVRQALKNPHKAYPHQPADECVNFKATSIPADCCFRPSVKIRDEVIEKCENACENANNTHCCMTDCKIQESGIYVSPNLNPKAIIDHLHASLGNISMAQQQAWHEAFQKSLFYCQTDQNSKDTTPAPIETTPDRSKHLQQSAIQQGEGRYVEQPSPQPEVTEATSPPPQIEPLIARQYKNVYCGVPIFVYRIIACLRVQNFVNCPNFNQASEVCQEKRDLIRKCGNELNYTS